jgi:hypothetical protein
MGDILVLCRFIPEGLQCSCGPDWYTVGTKYSSEYYSWFLFIFCFIMPLSLICFSYSQLLGTLRAVSGFREGQGGVGQGSPGEVRVSALEHKIYVNVHGQMEGVSKSSKGSGEGE